jgi:hypothetical protein
MDAVLVTRSVYHSLSYRCLQYLDDNGLVFMKPCQTASHREALML